MGILLVLGVFVLAFLCGRLQITVNQVKREMEEQDERIKKVQCAVEELED